MVELDLSFVRVKGLHDMFGLFISLTDKLTNGHLVAEGVRG